MQPFSFLLDFIILSKFQKIVKKLYIKYTYSEFVYVILQHIKGSPGRGILFASHGHVQKVNVSSVLDQEKVKVCPLQDLD